MQTPENVAKLIPFRGRESSPNSKYAPHLAKLATFVERHLYSDNNDKVPNAGCIIEIRRTDAEIAYYLGISMAALEQCFAELIRQDVIRFRGAHQIEILSKARLTELARHRG
jgi:hypothetical protein